MSPHRPKNWTRLLFEYVRPQVFVWGKADCVHFAAGWLAKLGYPEPLAGFGPWSSALGAAREIKRAGGFGPAVSARMIEIGCRSIPASHAQRGDIVLLQLDARRQALGIVIGAQAVAPGAAGLDARPLSCAVCAWSV